MREETEISSAELADVTAVNSIVKRTIAPTSPSTCEAAVGATSPIPICSAVSGAPIATAESPRVVASVNGIANQARPPIMNPLNADLGPAAIALC
jgi:hypothetical protein